jgi:hypothetical protein
MIGINIVQDLQAVGTIALSRITVPGLAEKRPSILRRDIMYLRLAIIANFADMYGLLERRIMSMKDG